MATRVGFAIAQGTQNPVSYSLIPELFPNNRTAAMAFYNSAIYVGRALSFGVVILAGHLAAGGTGSEVRRGWCWCGLMWWCTYAAGAGGAVGLFVGAAV